MRDIEAIDRELRLIDRLLDEPAATSASQRTNWSTTATMAARSAS